MDRQLGEPSRWPSFPGIEPTRQARVIRDAETQAHIHRPYERAARRTRFDGGYAVAHDANGRSGNGDSAAEKTVTPGGSRPDREGANHAAQFAAEAAAGPEGLMPRRLRLANYRQFRQLIFLIEIEKIRQPVHRQALFQPELFSAERAAFTSLRGLLAMTSDR
jgi:hypothetical protein